MKIVHLTEQALSAKALELLHFDMDSVRQIVASHHGKKPELWVADPDQYERGGRILRDSTSPRLLGYAPGTTTLYVTDGCNSCSHALDTQPGALTLTQLQDLSSNTGIRLELLRELSANDSQTFVP
ncbi:MAG TPA: hypothetical protein VFR05_08145 [Terriglobia bacterium]|nr:hypothetical protein [Terriglobia bacterium]